MSHVRPADKGPERVVQRLGGTSSLLVEAPGGHARARQVSAGNGSGPDPLDELGLFDGFGRAGENGWLGRDVGPEADLGDIVVVLLASTLAGLRDRLHQDGFDGAASLVHDLVEVTDDYVMRLPR